MADFINWSYDPQVNQQRATIILDMVRFIRGGLREDRYTGGPHPATTAAYQFEAEVKAALFEKMSSPMVGKLPKRMMQPHGDTLEMVAERFTKEHSWHRPGMQVACFYAGDITEQLLDRLGAIPTVDGGQVEAPTVETAFDVALSNASLASTRLTLLRVIPVLVGMRDIPMSVSVLRDDLWARKTNFHRDLLVFGGLAGGERLKTAIRTVAPEMCYSEDGNINFSVMHFLSRDGQSPGRWMTSTEDSLRQSIKSSYESL